MKTREFSFNLPEDLIAQYPAQQREDARLMVVDRQEGSFAHHRVKDLPSILPQGSLLVINNSKVRKARLFAISKTGGTVEFLFLKARDEDTWEVMVQKAKKQRPGKRFYFPGDLEGEMVSSRGPGKLVRMSRPLTDDYFETYGHVPLPPYIHRPDKPLDAERYQTVYSRDIGSVAAPTAGLHFTEDLLKKLADSGINSCSVTLHVGIGTFLPIRSQNIEDHVMHTEHYSVSESAAADINRAKQEGRPVIAVGTTSVRTIESAAREGVCMPGKGSTDLFIRPGYSFRITDHLMTNFHTPESSLLVMVAAFAGKNLVDQAYREAVDERYRFFSYGDAMLIR